MASATPRLSPMILPWVLHCNGRVAWSVNNEVGLSEADVVALCDAGNSSKRGREGRIGRKGIGFKSVFNLSDTPHVLSGRFAFGFDLKRNGPLGYVLPEALNDSALAALPPSALAAWRSSTSVGGTVIVLPLRAAAPSSFQSNMVAQARIG